MMRPSISPLAHIFPRGSRAEPQYEKKWRDPDDVYIDVERREEERKKRGLPLCVVGNILPRSAIAQAEERWEPEQERKKGRSLWAETFDDELTDIFVLQVVLQDAISEQVAQALSVELSKEDKTRLVKLYAKHKSLPAFA